MEYKLSDIFNLQMGKTPSRNNSDYWAEGKYDWISISDLSSEKYINKTKEKITDSAIEKTNIKIIPANTVIMSFKLSIGKTAITSHDMYSNEAIMAFIDKHKVELNTDFIYYLLQSVKWNTNTAVKGKTINKSIISKTKVNIPDYQEQCKIVKVLDIVTKRLKFEQKELINLDELIKARFVEMFGDPVQNSLNKPMVKLESLGNWKSGGTPARSNPNFYNGNINWFSAGELNSLYLSKSKEKITEEAVQKSSTKLFAKGSMLIGMYDTAAFKMGILKESSCANQACANIKVNEKVNVVWLYYELQAMKEYFLNQRHGVRQKNLTLKMIKKFEIPIFDLNLQNKFANFVQQVDKSKFENIVYLNKTLSSKILSQLGDAIRD